MRGPIGFKVADLWRKPLGRFSIVNWRCPNEPKKFTKVTKVAIQLHLSLRAFSYYKTMMQAALAFQQQNEQVTFSAPVVDLCERIYLRNYSRHLGVQEQIHSDWSQLLAQD